ncbi:hypothetical protein, partial [uncultured Oscillibacter sp.]|uniref:hypothetical protein n=1 Tax=uncultured Oscillibacter sp. TaxID=876091 RepID=UPI0026382652
QAASQHGLLLSLADSAALIAVVRYVPVQTGFLTAVLRHLIAGASGNADQGVILSCSSPAKGVLRTKYFPISLFLPVVQNKKAGPVFLVPPSGSHRPRSFFNVYFPVL